MMDPTFRLALEREMRLSIEVEAQITGAKSEPLLIVLAKSREQAAKALSDLAEIDPEDAKEIRRLQNEVRRFAELVTWLGQMFNRGREAEYELSEMTQAEAASYVISADDDANEGETYDD